MRESLCRSESHRGPWLTSNEEGLGDVTRCRLMDGARSMRHLGREAFSISSCAKSFYTLFQKPGLFLTMMAEGRIDLFRQAVRNMLTALRMPDVDENRLHDLTLRVSHTSRL